MRNGFFWGGGHLFYSLVFVLCLDTPDTFNESHLPGLHGARAVACLITSQKWH